jgi:hypothetical protein
MNPISHCWRSSVTVSCKTVLVLFALIATEGYCADLFRWQDDKGTNHYSDKPPTGVKAERIKQKRVRAPEVASEQPAPTEDPDAKRCADEKERLKALQKEGRIFMEERDGTRRELSADEIKQELAFSKRATDRFCKDGKKKTE